MGGHFFCLPIADGECRGSAALIFGLPYSFSLQNICVVFPFGSLCFFGIHFAELVNFYNFVLYYTDL